MNKFFNWGIAIIVVAVFAVGLIGCSQKKSEMPIGEIMANTATNANVEQPAANATVKTTNIGETEVYMPGAATGSTTTVATASAAATPERIQTALKNAGYYTGAIDGKIGPKSKKAIEAFQKDNGLKVDGKVGPKTWEKLQQHLGSSATTTTTIKPVAD